MYYVFEFSLIKYNYFLIENNTSIDKYVPGNLTRELLRLDMCTASQTAAGED